MTRIIYSASIRASMLPLVIHYQGTGNLLNSVSSHKVRIQFALTCDDQLRDQIPMRHTRQVWQIAFFILFGKIPNSVLQ